MGKKRSIKHVTDNGEENLSVPPGFVSLTSLTLKKTVTGQDAAREGECEAVTVGVPHGNSDIERFQTSLLQRSWISHGQRVRNQDDSDSEQSGDNQVVLYFLQRSSRKTYYHNVWFVKVISNSFLSRNV